jgi:hypothetical protein
MKRSSRLAAAALVVALVLLAVSLYLRMWGGVALVVVAAAGLAWYRMQVARSAEGDAFFADAGEDTRLTSFQGGSPSEMPLDRPPGQPPGSS